MSDVLPVAAAINLVRSSGLPVSPESVAAALQQMGFSDEAAATEIAKADTGLTPDHAGESGSQGKSRGLIEFIDLAVEIDSPHQHEWQIDGLIETHTTGAIFGASTAGKSFLAVDMALSVATGSEFLGATLVKSGPVIYFAGEGRHGIPRRAKAWCADKGIDLPRGRIVLPRGRVELDRIGASHVVEAIEEMAEPPVLIIIDTVARSLPAGSDENSAKDMMQFINVIDWLRDLFGCTVVLIHHTGHGQESQNRARGSSAFRAAMDWEILVDGGKNQVRFTKMKDAELPRPLAFEIVPIDDSAVFRATGEAPEGGAGITKGEELGLSTLRATCDRLKQGYAHVDEWRFDYYRRHHGDSVEAKKKAFQRVRESLLSKGIVLVDTDTYRPVGTKQNVPGLSRMSRDTRDTPLKGVPMSRTGDQGIQSLDIDVEVLP